MKTPGNYENLIVQFETWLLDSARYSKPTQRFYLTTLRNFLSYLLDFNILHLQDIELGRLKTFLHNHCDRSYALASVRVRVAALDLFFTWACENNYCAENPIIAYKKAQIQNKPLAKKLASLPKTEIMLLSPTEQTKLYAWIPEETLAGIRDKCLVLLILETALFAEEIINLHHADIQVENHFIKINVRGKRAREITLQNTEGRESYLAWLTIRQTALGQIEQPLLFFNQKFDVLSKRLLYKIVAGYLQQAGVEKIGGPDLLRQTAISRMLENKTLEEVQTDTGIKTIARLQAYSL